MDRAGAADDISPRDAVQVLPLTVRDVLGMPAFERATLVAGAAGVDNPIEWAHIVDIPDADFEWGRRRVLVLTAGYGLGDAEAQRRLVPRLAERGFAGLVLSLGYAVEEVPPTLAETADEHGFPLIELPHDVLFITLTEAIFAQLVNRQYTLLQRASDVRQELTDLVLRGGDLGGVAATLAALLERSVTIEDTDMHVLATARHGPVDDARRRSVEAGRTTAPLARHLEESGLYRRMLERMEPVRVPPVPQIGMTMDRVVAPIIVDRDLQGYIWVIAGERALTDLDELAIVHGATVAALILLQERAVRDAADSLRGDLLQQLLSGRDPTPDLEEQAGQVGVRLDRGHQVLVIRASAADARRLADEVTTQLAGAPPLGMAVPRPEGVVALVESDDGTRGERTAKALHDHLDDRHALVIGVGGVARPGNGRAPALRSSWLQAREAVEIALALGQRGVWPFRRLGLLHWLHHLPDDVRAGNRFLGLVADLAARDEARGTALLRTLEAFLDHGGATTGAAAALHLHRNTLLHRLVRLEEQLGLDLRDPLVRLELHVALRSYRLHGP